MKQPNPRSDDRQKKSKWIVWVVLGVVVLSVLYFVLTMALSFASANGINKFTGAKRAAAQEVYDLVRASELDNKNSWAYQVYIEDIYPTPAGTCKAGSQWSHNTGPNDPRYYTVVVRTKPLFWFGSGEKALHPGCGKYWLPEIGTGQELQNA